MTIFQYYFRILNKNKTMVILYTVLLLAFAGSNLKTSDSATNFVASKPDVYVMNQDEEGTLTELLYQYVEDHANILEPEEKDGKVDKEAVSDALFYRDVNYIIYIPNNFSQEFLEGKSPEISVESTGDYQASYMEMLLERFLNVAETLRGQDMDSGEMIEEIQKVLKESVAIELTTKLDTDALSKAAFFYNFANYSLLAGCVYVIAIILSSFRQETIQKRTVISATRYTSVNRQLLLANGVFALTLWAFYVLISIVLLKDIMLTTHGLLFVANSFVFAVCALSIGFFIGNLTSNKGALSGIVNVVALGSSFLCGSFVPMEYLPEGVIKVAHILPSYWYVQNNEVIATMESFEMADLKPLLYNGLVVAGFTLLFIVATTIVSKKKRVIR